MAATPSSRLDAEARAALLQTAVDAIEGHFAGSVPLAPPDLSVLPTNLALAGASFVSLHTRAGLRGCCGTIEPVRALALDVWRNAQASAFADPRFAPLAAGEWREVVELEVSVLSGFEPIDARSEPDLMRSLEPGVDGLVLSWRGQRATFLPKVWEQVDDARDFLARLKAKAGWHAGFWADDMAAMRYRTEVLSHPRPGFARLRRRAS
jgi:AmmeMemoRadiSam system protein A